MRLRARSVAAVIAAAAMLIAGCSGVPGSSAPAVIRTIDDGDVASVPPARGPLPGDDEGGIVAGFLRANISADLRHTSARQYLTAAAQSTWQDSPVTIVDALPRASIDLETETASLPIRRIGRVDADGTYTPALTDPSTPAETLSFSLVRVEGQWRIDRPPNGLYVTSDDFRLSYAQFALYFWDSAETTLVPDLRYSATRGQSLASFLLEQLLDPRRRTESQSLISRIPPQPSTSKPAIVVTSGAPTDVQLVGIRQLPPDAVPKVAAQLAYTFGPISNAAIRIVENGSPIQILGKNGTFRRADFASYSPDPTASSQVLYIRDGAVVHAPGSDPVTGSAGTGTLGLVSVASSGDETLQLAAVGGPGGQSLWIGAGDALLQPVALPEGTAPGPLSRPSWASRAGEVWVSDGEHLIRAPRTGPATIVPILLRAGGNADGTISAVRMSRDGARVAMIYGSGDERSLWIGSVVRTGSEVRIEPLTKITASNYVLSDVAWSDSTRLLITGSLDGEFGIWAVQADGSQLSERSTVGLPVAPIVSVTAAPAQFPWVAVNNAVWEQRGEQWSRATTDGRGSAPVYTE
ncbi:MAG: Lipoprotein LpqB, beta-propeller domain-like protein [Pseudonocardiales bacterium]|nr:Lipoprotein LpqB, beta-propeller domain-like protein [Jatrophihabitantaceae bacterium]MCW2604967.1 Lipoprotein LpqB, beta-propeller domain-like protein [Pseudonocardiales bacterium]